MPTKLLHDNFMATKVQVFLLQRLEALQTNRTLESRLAVLLVLFHGATHQVAAHSACLQFFTYLLKDQNCRCTSPKWRVSLYDNIDMNLSQQLFDSL